MPDKYNTSDIEFDPKHHVLKNKPNITNIEKLEQLETEALAKAYNTLSLEYSDTHVFSEKDVQYINKVFLKNIFDWAGTYRTVDISSPNIRWCRAQYIPDQMKTFGNFLSRITPFSPNINRVDILDRLSRVHGELILIHPFRNGNGRTTRLLCDLLVMQSGRVSLDRSFLEDIENREKYHNAIQQVWKEAKYDQLISLLELTLPS